MKKITQPLSLLLTLSLGLMLILSACNAKDEEVDTDTYMAAESVAITKFSLAPDLRVMRNLDSVYFSIDLEHGVVFNADSLPKGTNVTKLIPKITYPSSVTSAVIEMKGGTHREDGTVNYKVNPNDTIDFTGNVTITLSTANDAISKTYTLKVNVHQEDPDTLFWENMATATLPSRLPDPTGQKTINYGDGALSLIAESDGSLTIATTGDIFRGEWTKSALAADLKLDINSLSRDSEGVLYALNESGELMSSSNGIDWTAIDSGWTQIIGPYGSGMLGAKGNMMVSWPADYVESSALPSGFPTSGYTFPIETSNRWATQPTIVIFGGNTSTPAGSPAWAFDGSRWANIAENALPGLDGLSVIPYYAFLNNASNGLLKEFNALLAFGGRDNGGNLNNTIYLSYDNGINWFRAQDYMQLPPEMGTGYYVSAIAVNNEMEADLSNRWKAIKPFGPRRVEFTIDGNLIIWQCPHIFLFGGYDENSRLNTQIRTGVLRRLTFEPLF